MEEKKTDKSKSKSKAAKKQIKPAAPKKSPQGDIVFALDIGTRTVVGVLAKKTPQGCKIIDMETVTHSTRSMLDGQIEDIKSVAEDIKRVKRELENRRKIQLTSVYIAAAGRALKTLRAAWEYKLPPDKPITAETLKITEMDAVRRTCESFQSSNGNASFYCIGHSVISLSLDGFRVQKPEGHRGERLVTEIIGAFLPAYVVDSMCTAVDEAHLAVSGLTLEPIAAMNAVVPAELRLINCALCDIGAGTSDVAVASEGSVVAYGMATTAGDEITESIMRELLVDFNTAERIKISSEKEITYTDILFTEKKIARERVDKIIEPAARELAKIIADEIITANSIPPQAVFLVGGGSKLKGLPEYVAEALNVNTARVIAGKREMLRGIIAPDEMPLGAEHATPLGIAVSAGEGVSYDFTAITINGNKLRTLDTNRLTVSELMGFAKLTPDDMTADTGKSMSFTVLGEKITLPGEPPKPSKIIVNGEPASLNTTVTKGDDVTIVPAKNGADASAHLSDYFDFAVIKSFTVTLFGKKQRAGRYILLNGREITAERRIQDGDVISLMETETLGKLLASQNITGDVLLNDLPASNDDLLKSGDIITPVSANVIEPASTDSVQTASIESIAPVSDESVQTVSAESIAPANADSGTAEAAETSNAVTVPNAPKPANPIITINGIETEFPMHEDGTPPIFLDIAAAFSDDPTALLTSASTITINGKIARLDEEIRNGDAVVIE